MEAATITQPHSARQLDPSQRQDLALKLIKNEKPVSDIARDNNVSRKFLYQQKDKALNAIDTEFNKSNDSDVLFYIPVTTSWLISLILCLLLHCRSSRRGVQKVLNDVFDYPISIGTICNHAKNAASKAKELNDQQDLSSIKTATPDELFHHNKPILAGVDSRSLYCYLLTSEQDREADTWAIHLWDLEKQGFKPDRFIADDGKGLRSGHQLAYSEIPIDGDTFHIIQDMIEVRRFFRNKHKSAVSDWIDAEIQMDKAKTKNKGNHCSRQLSLAIVNESAMCDLSKSVDTLVSWMQHDVLQLAGLPPIDRRELYDFIVTEFKSLEERHPHRIRELRITLENQRDSVLGFLDVLDYKFNQIATTYHIDESKVWAMCELLRCNYCSDTHIARSEPLLAELGDELFEKIEDAVLLAMSTTDKTSCMVENLNSRIRPYTSLRKLIDNDFLQLLRFYLNHTPLLRSAHEYRKGKTPTQIMTGTPHKHWLEMLGLTRFTRAAA